MRIAQIWANAWRSWLLRGKYIVLICSWHARRWQLTCAGANISCSFVVGMRVVGKYIVLICGFGTLVGILAEGAIARPVTFCGGVLIAS